MRSGLKSMKCKQNWKKAHHCFDKKKVLINHHQLCPWTITILIWLINISTYLQWKMGTNKASFLTKMNYINLMISSFGYSNIELFCKSTCSKRRLKSSNTLCLSAVYRAQQKACTRTRARAQTIWGKEILIVHIQVELP